MFQNVIFFFLFLTVSSTILINAARLPSEGMLEGDYAKIDQFKYQVSIQSNGEHLCGGGIIDDEYILTAAHCVVDKENNFNGVALKVVAGTIETNKKEVRVAVEKIYIPTEYDRKTYSSGDIAVLKLYRSLKIASNPKLSKLELPSNTKETYEKKEVMLAGFGWDWIKVQTDPVTKKIVESGGRTTEKLKFTIATTSSNTECQTIYSTQKIYDSQICAGMKQPTNGKTSGVCTGDSGGPLVYNGKTIIGVLHASPLGCNEKTLPAIYTRVTSYLKFIENAKNDVAASDIRVHKFRRSAILSIS